MKEYMHPHVLCSIIYKMWYTHTLTHTREYYAAIKNKEVFPFSTTWIGLEGIKLCEIGHRKTSTTPSHLYVESKKTKQNKTKHQAHRYREPISACQRLVWVKRWRESEGTDFELHMVGDATGLHRGDDFTEYTMFYYAVHLKPTECLSIILKILNVYNGYNYYIKWINTKPKNFALISNFLKNLISNF